MFVHYTVKVIFITILIYRVRLLLPLFCRQSRWAYKSIVMYTYVCVPVYTVYVVMVNFKVVAALMASWPYLQSLWLLQVAKLLGKC